MHFKLVESSGLFFLLLTVVTPVRFTGPRNSGPEITDVNVKADVQIDGVEK